MCASQSLFQTSALCLSWAIIWFKRQGVDFATSPPATATCPLVPLVNACPQLIVNACPQLIDAAPLRTCDVRRRACSHTCLEHCKMANQKRKAALPIPSLSRHPITLPLCRALDPWVGVRGSSSADEPVSSVSTPGSSAPPADDLDNIVPSSVKKAKVNRTIRAEQALLGHEAGPTFLLSCLPPCAKPLDDAHHVSLAHISRIHSTTSRNGTRLSVSGRDDRSTTLVLSFIWAIRHPQTTYTINGLRDYHLLSLQSTITALDYVLYLCRSTDSIQPDDAKVRPLSQKMKPMDPEDFPLTEGAGYFVCESDFTQYQERVRPPKKEESTCNKFGAMGYGRYSGRVSGMVGLTCLRHMFVLPGSLVDLVKDEGFAWGDFAQLSGLQPWLHTLKLLCRGYDINCRYDKKFELRLAEFRKNFSHLQSIRKTTFPTTHSLISKFHVPAHTLLCSIYRSYNYTPGVGETDAKSLSTKHKNAQRQLALALEHLQVLEENIADECKLSEWRQIETVWEKNVIDPKKHRGLQNPYILDKDKGLTEKQLLDMMQKVRAGREEQSMGPLSIIPHEELLDELKVDDISEAALETLKSHCEMFLSEVLTWNTVRDAYLQPLVDKAFCLVVEKTSASMVSSTRNAATVPGVTASSSSLDGNGALSKINTRARASLPRNPKNNSDLWQEVYASSILMPSAYDALIVVGLEMEICREQARDALDEVRMAIIGCMAYKIKKIYLSSKTYTTRATNHIRIMEDAVRVAANRYCHAHVALLALSMDQADPEFRLLRKEDTVKYSLNAQHRTLGESSEGKPWIWERFSFSDTQGDGQYQAYFDDTQCVHWFCSSALKKHWHEELCLLQEEMCRPMCFFHHHWRRWMDAARKRELDGHRGAAAYARKQAHRYTRLLRVCQTEYAGWINLGFAWEESGRVNAVKACRN
ncbi:hypothetical protein FKP32DRAFT_1600802 [Trametes sanguinea]|nr:hypothetical protein FKP32DRAFT_1600802 [Trametes sanguinea]